MSNAGRKAIPTKMKVLKGTYRKDRAKNEPEPSVMKTIPDAPEKLNKYGKEEWIRAGNELVDAGIFSTLDYALFETYCYYHGKHWEYEELLNSEGRVLLTDKGYAYMNPVVSLSKSAYETANKLAPLFGITPSARSRINLPKKQEKDELEDL